MDLSHVISDLMVRVTELERVVRCQDEHIFYLRDELGKLKGSNLPDEDQLEQMSKEWEETEVWCICDNSGTCLGCLIEDKVGELFGNYGKQKLKLIVRKSEKYDESRLVEEDHP